MKDIDFVIIWVDGNDPKWQEEKRKYNLTSRNDDRPERYREWDNLKYWFRGVEKFAPWVRKIHFVTWGHVPKWLNVENSKLNIVNHKDFISSEYLPMFNSDSIEMNIHKIKGLTEQFVYFNDDMFIIRKTNPEDFFKNGLPCDSAVLNVHCYSEKTQFHFAPIRAVGIMNKYFNMKDTICNNPTQWFNLKYGMKNLQSLVLLGCPRFPGFWQHHLPTSFLKKTFEELWEKETHNLKETCTHRFRDMLDFNQWVFREWQLVSGEFYPRHIKNTGKAFELRDSYKPAILASKYISNQKGKMICINDGDLSLTDFEKSKQLVNQAFDKILPEKSSFEK